MKKLLALLLVALMFISLVACGDSVQEKADAFIKDYRGLVDDMAEAIENEDEKALENVSKKIEKLMNDNEDLADELKKEDKKAAEKFEEDVLEITKDYYELVSGILGDGADELGDLLDEY